MPSIHGGGTLQKNNCEALLYCHTCSNYYLFVLLVAYVYFIVDSF